MILTTLSAAARHKCATELTVALFLPWYILVDTQRSSNGVLVDPGYRQKLGGCLHTGKAARSGMRDKMHRVSRKQLATCTVQLAFVVTTEY